MKIKYKEKIGEYTVIWFITDAVVDPEATKDKIESLITSEMTEADIEQLYMANLVYAKVGPEADLLENSVGEAIQQKLNNKGENQLLLDNGEYVDNYCGVEYWILKSGKWAKEKIENIGIALPSGAVLPDQLTGEQQAEIYAQQEAERIAAMPPEEKATAKQAALDALADEADRLDRRAKIQNQIFDPILWYRERADAVEAKYVG